MKNVTIRLENPMNKQCCKEVMKALLQLNCVSSALSVLLESNDDTLISSSLDSIIKKYEELISLKNDMMKRIISTEYNISPNMIKCYRCSYYDENIMVIVANILEDDDVV